MVRAHGRLRTGLHCRSRRHRRHVFPRGARHRLHRYLVGRDLSENGWGVNLVQNEDVIFATFFVYDISKQPTWYSSPMCVDANGIYSGTLYADTGPWFGGPWTGSAVATPVGTSVFTPTSATTGTLTYTVNNADGVSTIVVTKSIQRTPFRPINLRGSLCRYRPDHLVRMRGQRQQRHHALRHRPSGDAIR